MSEPLRQPEIYDYKYSDRDVRENPELRNLALSYVEQYGGDFDPMVRAKRAMIRGEELNTTMIRTVLNCMRVDAQVAASLPAPEFPFVVAKRLDDEGRMGRVIPMQRDRRSKTGEEHCGSGEPHEYHSSKTDRTWCGGTPFPINRHGRVATRGRIRMNFGATKSGALVHKLTRDAKFIWQPHRHEWGFVDHPISVSVKTGCKNPSWLHDAHLFKEEPVHLYADEIFAKERCPRCFTVTELQEGPPPMKLGIPQVVFQPPEI